MDDYIPSEYQNNYEIVNIPFSSLQNKKNKAKELIDEGVPVILSLTNYDYTTNIGTGSGNLQEVHICISIQGIYSCTICPYEGRNIIVGPNNLFLKKPTINKSSN